MPDVQHILLVGGGLQSALVALALDAANRDVRVTLVERGERLGGNHTWCFFDPDLTPAQWAWVAPLVTHSWSSYEVHFPGLSRTVETAYHRLDAERLDKVVSQLFERRDGWTLRLNTEARIEGATVHLGDAEALPFDLCVWSTGPVAEAADASAGYQKFVGAELTCAEPHGIAKPMLMDVVGDQTDGLRFLYVLPLSERGLLVEDTRFSDNPRLAERELLGAIEAYLTDRGHSIANRGRTETGILPMPWSPASAVRPVPNSLRGGAIVHGGYQGGWFHPGTGYSLPVAARFAEAVASGQAHTLHRIRSRTLAQQRRARALNRVLFQHYEPEDRWRLIQRFYQRPTSVIERFYALRLSWADLARIVIGPIPQKLRWLPRPRPGVPPVTVQTTSPPGLPRRI